jgi:eukaryotic-like serine/threonine-protein kinase
MTDPGQSAEKLFGEALELPPESRPAFLDQACSHDPELRRLLEQLLVDDARAGSFLAHPPFTPDGTRTLSAAGPPVTPGRLQSGQLIAGRFAIVRFVARGGMGEVYEAKDQFLQDAAVALKIIRPDIAADATTSARFEQEVLLARKVVHPKGINPAVGIEAFVSLTSEGRPAVMSQTGAAQIYLLRWPQ